MEKFEIEGLKVRTLDDIFAFDNIVLWGVGFAFKDCLEFIGHDKVDAVFDNNSKKWGLDIEGFIIKRPDTDLRKYITEKTAVIISANGYQYEIAVDLIGRGLNEEQLFTNTNLVMEEDRYDVESILNHVDEIMYVYNRLDDEDSRFYYSQFMKACLTRNPLYFTNNPSSPEGYEYKSDIASVGLSGGEVILDCGAFTGDTAKKFLDKTDGDCEIYCFEPVASNYNKIVEWINEEKIENVFAVNSGVGDSNYTTKVYSAEGRTIQAAVGVNRFEDKNPTITEVKVSSIDNMMIHRTVDYIKMDIEGAEMDALKGAQKTICSYKPQMLISGYHKVSDMWEVPGFILKLNSDYKVFLGHQIFAASEPEFLFVMTN